MTPDEGPLPLEGITVVALEQAVAAPLATRHLADLGARVIKVERVGDGDFARHYDAAVRGGVGSHFVWLNRGKESVALDLKTEAGRDAIRTLTAGADVFVQNLAPGAAGRLGLSADDLRADHPELVVVDMSGYGDAGPYRDRKAYDMLVQAEAGLISVTGTPEEMAKTGIPSSDIAAGMYALTSVLSALLRRATTGLGARVSVAMFDATVEWMGHPMYLRLYGGRQIARAGLGHAAIVPYDKYPTQDGDILIGVQNDRGWDALTRVALDRPDLADDPRYRTNIDRVSRRAEVDAVISAETKRFTTDELDRRLAEAGIPAAEIRDLEGVVDHPQLSERGRWREVDTEVGPVRALLPPLTFDDVELAMGPVPALGQHTEEVLREFGIDVPQTPSA
ncbi:CaiB/BaiF CoA transferase family protein [Gordonia sp. KTR9]|uniref:CaiB/BaiF CoA transferase family protein n=1 Tax=Gordonia sp. KTR9 TaxID=337191 RepID=UPI00027DDF1C|nr:CaiB/BaiF CoA-transferase family protein [Gordonia sp. KTR9]AFR51177.1 putative acyl-CoA transferase, carnitine dehydratase [Gordonia sp. KTR9]